MTDVEREILEQLRELRLMYGGLAAQSNKNEGTLQALVTQVVQLEEKVDALPKEPPSRSSVLRDGTLTLSGGAVTALLSFIAQHWSK